MNLLRGRKAIMINKQINYEGDVILDGIRLSLSFLTRKSITICVITQYFHVQDFDAAASIIQEEGN